MFCRKEGRKRGRSRVKVTEKRREKTAGNCRGIFSGRLFRTFALLTSDQNKGAGEFSVAKGITHMHIKSCIVATSTEKPSAVLLKCHATHSATAKLNKSTNFFTY